MTKHVECRRGVRVVWISENLGEIEMGLGCCEHIASPEARGGRVNAHGFWVAIEKSNRTLLVECLTLEHFRLETKRSLRHRTIEQTLPLENLTCVPWRLEGSQHAQPMGEPLLEMRARGSFRKHRGE
jgi:hypothetical protein